MTTSGAIGVFDSGLGGLTVLRKIIEALPQEDFHYLGDTARLPYGDKSPETIVRYSLQNASFLYSNPIKAMIIACNTSAAYAVDALQKQSPVPIINVIDPTVEMAVNMTRSGRIAVLGTKATIRSGAYERKIQSLLPYATVISAACPLFVPLVEENFIEHPAAKMIVQEYLRPLKMQNVDTVILGCTHYPLLLSLIQEEMGDAVTILDSASQCALKVLELLKEKKLVKSQKNMGMRNFYVSDDPEKFQRLGTAYLGIPIEKVSLYVNGL